MSSQLFRTKPLGMLLEEAKGENRLRRVLGPVQLSALGVGAIIGAGIFVATGAAAHNQAGPAPGWDDDDADMFATAGDRAGNG